MNWLSSWLGGFDWKEEHTIFIISAAVFVASFVDIACVILWFHDQRRRSR